MTGPILKILGKTKRSQIESPRINKRNGRIKKIYKEKKKRYCKKDTAEVKNQLELMNSFIIMESCESV